MKHSSPCKCSPPRSTKPTVYLTDQICTDSPVTGHRPLAIPTKWCLDAERLCSAGPLPFTLEETPPFQSHGLSQLLVTARYLQPIFALTTGLQGALLAPWLQRKAVKASAWSHQWGSGTSNFYLSQSP